MKIDILKLHSEDDRNWREWIRVSGENLHKFFKEIVSTKTNLRFKEKVNKKVLSDWSNGRSSIPIWVIRDICEEFPHLKERILEKVERLKLFRSQEVHLPKEEDAVLLAEIIGRHCGDGSCSINGSDFKISLKEHPSLIEIHAKELKQLFGINTHITHREKFSEITFRSKIFARILTNIFEIPPGKQKTRKVKEPSIIRESGINVRIGFLRGLIDTDGCIKKSGVLSFTTVNENLASSVFEILSQLGLHPIFVRERKRKVFQIRVRKSEVPNFLMLVGSKNERILSKAVRVRETGGLPEKGTACRENPPQGKRD
jgi:intein/homing endonuclease